MTRYRCPICHRTYNAMSLAAYCILTHPAPPERELPEVIVEEEEEE